MEIHMRHIQTRRPLPKKREGFTLIELLVVISIIATLVALITPAVQSAREAARRTQCINNMKNIALAVKNFASQNDGEFPTFYRTYTGSGATFNYGWPVSLLSFLDNAALYDKITSTGGLPNSAGVMGTPPADFTPGLYLQVFVCPDDLDKDSLGGGLSYAANIGYVPGVSGSSLWGSTGGGDDPTVDGIGSNYTPLHARIDWDGNGSATTANINQSRDTGVFMGITSDPDSDATNGNDISMRPITEDGVSRNDGLAQTLMLAENLQATNWASYRPGDVGFGYPIDTFGATTAVLAPGATPYSLAVASGWSPVVTSALDPRINKNLQASVGTKWRPSSNHPGMAVVAFCDGRARALNDNIDSGVYFRLISSGGTKRHSQRLVGDDF
jgi:prepilin-type N-terminal cleavage/methylation domain-containing protein